MTSTDKSAISKTVTSSFSPRTLTREEINALPLDRYEGKVKVIGKSSQVAPAVKALKDEEILGFDVESRPVFRKGDSFPPALLQLGSSDCVYLFRLNLVGFPRSLRRILSDEKVKKVGVALDRDVKQLQELKEFEPAGFIELASLTSKIGIENNGLRGLCAAVLGFRISKKGRMTNWANPVLTPYQVTYAATDAWASREIYTHLQKSGLI